MYGKVVFFFGIEGNTVCNDIISERKEHKSELINTSPKTYFTT